MNLLNLTMNIMQFHKKCNDNLIDNKCSKCNKDYKND